MEKIIKKRRKNGRGEGHADPKLNLGWISSKRAAVDTPVESKFILLLLFFWLVSFDLFLRRRSSSLSVIFFVAKRARNRFHLRYTIRYFSALWIRRCLGCYYLFAQAARLGMAISKTEINFRRLLAAAPQQQNQAKLIHYVATLREQLEQLAEERTPDGLPRVSKAMVNDYSKKIEEIAAKFAAPLPSIQVPRESFDGNSTNNSPNRDGDTHIPHSPGLRRRFVPVSSIEDKTTDVIQTDALASVKLDAASKSHIERHRKLQEDLTDEMVGLARQLKESSLVMSQSVQNTERILDSTEKAIEQSLAGTGRANVRASEVYSKGSKTTCFTWLVMFLMTFIFIMVVLLIRVT